ncbi:DUF6498-containing protein [Aquisalinus flavus]|uniref:Uncharacterized protein n=1 Tax=Aquisalinus flavus TaxID=1526572 RepID=A0A8J2Y568_9PROT|nr:DUF6498-containing protein [Aquisalinus flavus]MBD0426292.1 hypothetical protein [Aquisalinus flavus]UNE48140.1 hypothetical protein FF099_08795 [Aquisalinus flavus]GGD09114.1 hypothetical protein GCM10011342_17450 [Aquisalinus flavus]
MSRQDPYDATRPAGLDPKGYSLTGDTGLWFVVLGNLFIIGLAKIQGWPLGEVLWVYWLQSIIIGVVHFFRLLALKDFSTENFTMNGRSVEPTQGTKISVAIFFAFHYGFFHIVYGVFLLVQYGEDLGNAGIGLAVIVFLVSHIASLISGGKAEDVKLNIGSMMFMPYLRIVPMHLIIMLGGVYAGLGIVLFMAMKTIADGGMHVVEQLIYGAGAKAAKTETRRV